MGFKAVRAARVPLELGKLEGEEVVGRISKRCVTQAVQDDTNERSFIVSADADGEVVTEHCEYVWIKLISINCRHIGNLPRIISYNCF